jgi:hypothetical protein
MRLKKDVKESINVLPSKACWTLLFKFWVLFAFPEDGPPEDEGLDVRLIKT